MHLGFATGEVNLQGTQEPPHMLLIDVARFGQSVPVQRANPAGGERRKTVRNGLDIVLRGRRQVAVCGSTRQTLPSEAATPQAHGPRPSCQSWVQSTASSDPRQPTK
jgi:hypothetical protein